MAARGVPRYNVGVAPRRSAAALLAFCLLLLSAAGTARAGGGPETTVVVANGASPASMRVAHEFARRRGLPADHVVVLEGVPLHGVMSVDAFRAKVLEPLEALVETGGRLEGADALAWSVDFPYGVDFEADKPRKDLAVPFTPIASWTSMTYLWRKVLAKDANAYLHPRSNRYYRRAAGEADPTRDPTSAERDLDAAAQAALVEQRWEDAAKAYASLAATLPAPEVLYNLACCLARLGRSGDAVAALDRAATAGFLDAEHAQRDPDFESLRGRDDFAALLARMKASAALGVQPTHAFSSAWTWTGGAAPATEPDAASLDRYLLSTALGYTGPFGNTVAETLASVERAAAADGTRPTGTFYFLVNDDVRAKTRSPRFPRAVEALRAVGQRAEILEKGVEGQDGVVPVGKDDVLGAMLGIASFDWDAGKSRILPGAIVEHLTSHGADFAHGGQTKLAAAIRAGAVGSSGTVHEPYAVPFKFPVPELHLHYALGASLAEAFYQSLSGPYQTYVVGDPLCRPFAHLRTVEPALPKGAWAGKVTLPVRVGEGPTLARLLAYVDGRLVGAAEPGAPLALDTAGWDDGAHDLHVVAVEAGPIATRSSARTTIQVANVRKGMTLVAPASVGFDDTVTVTGKVPGATAVTLRVGGRSIQPVSLTGGTFKATFSASSVGPGPVEIVARATWTQGPAWRGAKALQVAPPALRKPTKATGKTEKGFLATLTPAEGKPLTRTLATLGGPGQKPSVREALAEKGPGPWKEVRIDGEVEVTSPGLYTFLVHAAGEVALDVGGKPAKGFTAVEAGGGLGVLVGLEAGWHEVSLRFRPKGAPDLTVLLGGDRVAAPLTGASVRHR